MNLSSSTSKQLSLGTKLFYLFNVVLMMVGATATFFGIRGVFRA